VGLLYRFPLFNNLQKQTISKELYPTKEIEITSSFFLRMGSAVAVATKQLTEGNLYLDAIELTIRNTAANSNRSYVCFGHTTAEDHLLIQLYGDGIDGSSQSHSHVFIKPILIPKNFWLVVSSGATQVTDVVIIGRINNESRK